MSGTYVVWRYDLPEDRNFCCLGDLVNVEDDYELGQGISRKKNFPDDARYKMHPSYKSHVELADSVYNLDGLIVVSTALRDFIVSKTKKNIEYLPVAIINHKGKTASDDYFILNPVKPQECIDAKQSKASWSTLFTDRIEELKKLVIHEDSVDPQVKIFRPAAYTKPVLVERGLAEAILEAGFTGVRWVEAEKFPES